jgi:hypothetical protein
MGVCGQRHAPIALPSGKTRNTLYSRLGGPQSRSGRMRKISPHRDSIPGSSRPKQVAIPTALSRLLQLTALCTKYLIASQMLQFVNGLPCSSKFLIEKVGMPFKPSSFYWQQFKAFWFQCVRLMHRICLSLREYTQGHASNQSHLYVLLAV